MLRQRLARDNNRPVTESLQRSPEERGSEGGERLWREAGVCVRERDRERERERERKGEQESERERAKPRQN